LSIGESMRVIRRGAADACLSGGCDSKLNPMALLRQIFAGRLLETDLEDESPTLLRPYAEDSSGTLLGEGGGILVLEALESLEARGGNAIAELAGFSASQSSCPDTVGLVFADDDDGVINAITGALADAGMDPEDIDVVVPFGSGIQAMDTADRRAIQGVFKDRAAEIPLVLPIPYVGNCGAGAGAISVAVAASCIAQQRIPARINVEGVEGLNANAAPAKDAKIRAALAYTTSFGGHNAAVVLKAMEGQLA
jgi:3-oxoacyl-[acyl-carrier-protein] synthase II